MLTQILALLHLKNHKRLDSLATVQSIVTSLLSVFVCMTNQLNAVVITFPTEPYSIETVSQFSEVPIEFDLSTVQSAHWHSLTPPPAWDLFGGNLFQQQGVEMIQLGGDGFHLQELITSLVEAWSKPNVSEAAGWIGGLGGYHSFDEFEILDRESSLADPVLIPEPSSSLFVLLAGSLLIFKRRLTRF